MHIMTPIQAHPPGKIWISALLGCFSVVPLLIGPIITGVLIDAGDFSNREAGLTAAFGAIGTVSVALLCALTMHHLSLRYLAIFGLFLAAPANIGAALLYDHHQAFFALRTITAFGDGAVYAAVMSSYARQPNSEQCYGIFMMLQFGLAAIALWALPTWLPDLSVSQLYLGMCTLNILGLLLVTSLPRKTALSEGISIRASEWRLLLAVPAMAGLLALCAFETSNTGSDAFLERVAVFAGFSDEQIGLSLGVASLVGVPGAFAIFWVGSHFGHAKPIFAGVIVGAVSLVGLVLADGFYEFFAWTCIHSFTWAFTLPYIQSLLADMDAGGAVIAAGGLASGAGGGIGPATTGMLVTSTNYNGVLIVGLAAYLVTGLAVLVAWKSFSRPP